MNCSSRIHKFILPEIILMFIKWFQNNYVILNEDKLLTSDISSLRNLYNILFFECVSLYSFSSLYTAIRRHNYL